MPQNILTAIPRRIDPFSLKKAVTFNLFTGMEPFGAFRVLAQSFLIFQLAKNYHFLYSVRHKKY